MRNADASDPLPALSTLQRAPKRPGTAAGAPPPVGAAQERLAEIADAVTAERLDACLEPILGLADRRAQHYEFSLRLRTSRGESMGPDEYGMLARGVGLLPALDAASLTRLAKVIAYVVERGTPGALFVSVSGESLSSDHLPRLMVETYRRGSPAAERAVLSFAQSDVRAWAPAQWGVLKKINDLGLRFAIEDVTTFDIDFKALNAAGFSFLKADAGLFLGPAGVGKGEAELKELSKRLTQSGLALIVTSIEHDQQLASLGTLGVPLGQGPMFGGPRPVKADVTRSAGGVAA
jgi:cyclic-di-GMP phosphodiesterase TipF (flagellum assembly factor)